jgi:hypothetical protein
MIQKNTKICPMVIQKCWKEYLVRKRPRFKIIQNTNKKKRRDNDALKKSILSTHLTRII